MLVGKDRWELPAPPWYLNSGATRTITQDMSVDTRFRPDYYTTLSTNFTMELPEPQKKVLSMRISAMEMPMTYYSISAGLGNNSMLIISDELRASGTVYCDVNGNTVSGFTPTNNAWLVHMADGNYDTISWMNTASRAKAETAVNEALTLAKPGAIDELGKFYKLQSPTIDDYLNGNFNSAGVTQEPEKQDIRFIMNKINGKSAFATPQPSDVISGLTVAYINEKTNLKKLSRLRFNVDTEGKFRYRHKYPDETWMDAWVSRS